MSPKKLLRDAAVSLLALVAAFALGLFFQRIGVEEHITTVFVFAVFLISLFTEGYAWGLVSALAATLATNYVFAYPYFAFDFINPVNLVSAVVLVTVSLLTSALTTKLKRHEAAKAEGERERMRANLLRAVSHDLRTPLTAIYTASSTLRDKAAVLTPAQQDAMLENIQQDSEWLTRMVENLLSVTRLDDGAVLLHKAPTIVDELVDSTVAKFRARHPRQAVTVELEDDVTVVAVDALLIQQVLLNLLENAVYHADGMTQLSLRVFTLSDRVIFEVADDGCGLAEEKLRRLLDGNGDSAPSAGEKRFAGIGLSVCASILKAHGSEICAENRKRGGALFRFALTKEESFGGE